MNGNNILKGYLGVKGEQGFSAYEIAVKHGFVGSEQDWLATLGTSSMFDQFKTTITTSEETNQLPMPEKYIEASFVDIYVDGLHLLNSEYEIIKDNDKFFASFITPIASGKTVEIVVTTMTTFNLPISDTIDSESTNETASGTKSVYDFVNEQLTPLNNIIEELGLDVDTYDETAVYSRGDIVIKNYKIYECQADEITGTWDSGQWLIVKIIVGDE